MIVWSYVITVDGGGAPNFLPPATTLTLCKPKIRQRARRGDLVIAFNGQSLHPEPLGPLGRPRRGGDSSCGLLERPALRAEEAGKVTGLPGQYLSANRSRP
jgi:hypothetical protein